MSHEPRLVQRWRQKRPPQTTVVVEDDGTLGRYDVGEDDDGKLNECHRLRWRQKRPP